uniref:Uncharacterized protein n=1 Tax=Oryza barthii TaxID=65489 RepID=A0A0D3EN42_9ORYZ
MVEAREMAGNGGGASQMQPSSSLHHSATARDSSSTSAGKHRVDGEKRPEQRGGAGAAPGRGGGSGGVRWSRRRRPGGPAWPRAGRRSQRGGGPEQDEDGGGRSGNSSGRRWRSEVQWQFIRAEMEVGGADNRGGEVAVARGWCSRRRCSRARWQRPSMATAWCSGGEGKEVAGSGGEWPDGRPFFFSDVAQGYLRPTASKTDSRPPHQHNKYPLDGAVSLANMMSSSKTSLSWCP